MYVCVISVSLAIAIGWFVMSSMGILLLLAHSITFHAYSAKCCWHNMPCVLIGCLCSENGLMCLCIISPSHTHK